GRGQPVRKMIEAFDTELGRLLANIPPDVLGRTTIFLTADNGTASTEAEPWVKSRRAQGPPFDRGAPGPPIRNGVGGGAPRAHPPAPVDLADIFPTLAEWVGVDLDSIPSVLDPNAPYKIDGISLTSYLEDPNAPALRQYQYSDLFDPPGPGPHA